MKFLLKLAFLLALLAQAPFLFALYQSYQLKQYLESFPREEVEAPFQDVRGVIHVHSAAGAHSLGTYPEIIEAAKAVSSRYVFITEHPHDVPLFVPIQDPDVVIIYGWEEDREDGVRVLRSPGGEVSFLTHYLDRAGRRARDSRRVTQDEVPGGVTGLEIYNIHSNAERRDSWYHRVLFAYHYFTFRDLFFFHLWEMDPAAIRLWDRGLQSRPLTAIAGNDAHQNVGLLVKTAAGRPILEILLDPYTWSLGFVNTHVLLPLNAPVTEATIINALRTGSTYVAFGAIADPTGFSFHAETAGQAVPPGSQVRRGARLVFQTPGPARHVLLRDGTPYRTLEGRRFYIDAGEAGVYRLEVYPLSPPALLEDRPWILSNAITVR